MVTVSARVVFSLRCLQGTLRATSLWYLSQHAPRTTRKSRGGSDRKCSVALQHPHAIPLLPGLATDHPIALTADVRRERT